MWPGGGGLPGEGGWRAGGAGRRGPGGGGRRRRAPGRGLQKGRACCGFSKGAFGDVLQAADVVVGLAGTANEQAAGLGKPVVVFPGPGVQFGPRFFSSQRLLLGDALAVVAAFARGGGRRSAGDFADPARRERMAAVGRERMGPPGAAGRMADAIGRLWGLESEGP